MMHYGTIKTYDIANGPGCRVSLFVSGCRNHCKGCFQPETWDFEYGQPFTNKAALEIIDALAKPGIQGLSILGGEPLEPENQKDVYYMMHLVKFYKGSMDIWLYTGYIYDNNIPKTAFTQYILETVDILVDGPFIKSQKDISLQFRGSRNQRIIDMAKTREEGRVVLWTEKY